MVEEKEEFQMGIPNGVGEAMLAHASLQLVLTIAACASLIKSTSSV